MKKNILKTGLILSTVLMLFISCSSDDASFPNSPVEREEARNAELKNLLVDSEYGWSLLYFTNDTEIGGFSYLMKFHEDNTVDMTSDFRNDNFEIQKSEYEIQSLLSTSLVFTTHTFIHELSDPMVSAITAGRGYEGEFQFVYLRNEGEEIVFRSTKNADKEIRFVKATADDWSNFENREIIINSLSNPNIPIFRSVEIVKNGAIETYDAIYNVNNRFMELGDASNQDFLEERKGFGVGFTSDGAIVSPSLKVDGMEFTDFSWNQEEEDLVSEQGGVKLILKSVEEPTNWPDDYKNYLFSNNVEQFVYDTQYLLGSPSVTQGFRDYIEGFGITRIMIQAGGGTLAIIQVNLRDGGTHTFLGTLVDEGNSFSFNQLIVSSSGGEMSRERAQEMMDYLANNGKIFLKKQSYNIQYANQIITLYIGGLVFDMWVI